MIHSISLPPGVYGGDSIERLFTNRLDWDAHPYFATIRGLEVSSHFVIRRDSRLQQFVSCDDRPGMRADRGGVAATTANDFSVGIELEGLEGETFEPHQYETLTRLLRALSARYPIRGVAGHEHVAPGRKADPGAGFDWGLLRTELGWPDTVFASVAAPPASP